MLDSHTCRVNWTAQIENTFIITESSTVQRHCTGRVSLPLTQVQTSANKSPVDLFSIDLQSLPSAMPCSPHNLSGLTATLLPVSAPLVPHCLQSDISDTTHLNSSLLQGLSSSFRTPKPSFQTLHDLVLLLRPSLSSPCPLCHMCTSGVDAGLTLTHSHPDEALGDLWAKEENLP